MDENNAVIADLEHARNRAMDLIRVKLDAVAEQVREAAARTVGELGVVLPADPEMLFPISQLQGRLGQSVGQPAPVPATSAVDMEAWRALDAGRSQSEVLQELLRQLEPFCGARVIVVFREGQVSGWSGAGFAAEDQVRSWHGAIADSDGLRKVAEGWPVLVGPASDAVIGSWAGLNDERILLIPMTMRGKIVGALVAQANENALDVAAVQLMTWVAGLLLETLAVRPTVPTPAISEPLELARVTPPAALPEERGAAPAVEVYEEAVPEEAAESEGTTEPEEIVDAGTTMQVEIPPPAVSVPEPGLAAAPPRSAEEERKHEEARRFARLLVSEIRLYNEQAVLEGKKARDIYQRLREDIDRSREMYEQRVPGEVRAGSNYFFEELVRILAEGDADALGL